MSGGRPWNSSAARRLAAGWRERLKLSATVRPIQRAYLDDLANDVGRLDAARFGAERPGPVLTGAVLPDDNEIRTMATALAKALKEGFPPLKAAADRSLIAGYRLEIGGLVIDRNLHAEINQAIREA